MVDDFYNSQDYDNLKLFWSVASDRIGATKAIGVISRKKKPEEPMRNKRKENKRSTN